MAHLNTIPSRTRESVVNLDCPVFETTPFVTGPALSERRVAVISSAGIHLRDDRVFELGASDFRIIPSDADPSDIVMSHISVNYDRSGYYQDINTILPMDRLAECQKEGLIGSVAPRFFACMGATDPGDMKDAAAQIAGMLKADRVDAVLLVPV